MSATVTVTGTNGPGLTVTALVIENAIEVAFDTVNNILSVTKEDGYVENFDVSDATTITATKSGSTYTFVVS